MSMSLFLQQFHFLRPEWLLAIMPAVLMTYFFWQQKNSAANWQGAISQSLLSHLIDDNTSTSKRWPWLLLLLAWLISAIALAGPSWKKLPQPIHQRQDALVIVMDLSLSMLAEDTKPSRLLRARHKILDVLKQRKEGLTALVAYSADAHIVSPLTDDNATIANLAPALTPNMMPAFGSNPVAAITQAKALFKNAGINYGRILLITDGITQYDVDDIDNHIINSGFELSIMGIGSVEGAPIPAKEGYLKDNNNNIIIAQLQRQPLEQLAKQNNGRYTDASLNDDDIIFLLPATVTPLDDSTIVSQREFDQWQDRGALLALLLLPLSLLAFRRGWLLLLPLLIFDPQYSYAQQDLLPPEKTSGLSWQRLWQRPDQLAAKQFANGDAKAAAEQFTHQQWKASAQYQTGDFKSAAKNFSADKHADAHYNRGNALAKFGQLDQAIEAYNEALKLQPTMDDALANKALVENLKNQQQEESQQDQNKEKEDNKQEKKDNQQQQNGSDSGDQDQDQDQDQEPNDDKQQDSQSQQQEKNSDNTTDDQPKQQEQEQEQEQSPDQPSEQENNDKQAQKTPTEPTEADPEQQQKQQAMEQMLRKIPDDPSGLLRRKFNYEHQLRQQQGSTTREQPQW